MESCEDRCGQASDLRSTDGVSHHKENNVSDEVFASEVDRQRTDLSRLFIAEDIVGRKIPKMSVYCT